MPIDMQGCTPYVLKTDSHSSHSQVARWILSRCALEDRGPKRVILDVGCAGGFLGHLLPESKYALFGVDIDERAMTRLPPIYTARYVADIEDWSGNGLPARPDVIVFADVLEHTRRPAEALRRILSNALDPGTRVVISVPNVAHLYVRASLLMGRFQYAERGILDQSHLRFFTYRSALELCSSCDVRVDELAVTPVPLPLVHPVFGPGNALAVVHVASARLASAFPNLLGYQILLFGTYLGRTMR